MRGDWGRQHNEERHGVFSLPNVVRVSKLLRTRCSGHVASVGDWRVAYRFLMANPEGKPHMENLSLI